MLVGSSQDTLGHMAWGQRAAPRCQRVVVPTRVTREGQKLPIYPHSSRISASEGLTMPFVLIRGAYFPAIGEPDGDSVRFAADDISLWDRLDGRRRPGVPMIRCNFVSRVSMPSRKWRFSHWRQRPGIACSISSGLPRERSRPVATSCREPPSHGRPIVFAFAGDPPEADGTDVFLDAARLRESVNFKQMQAGFAYPLYYNTLFRQLRETLNEAVDEACANQRGNWPTDATQIGVTVSQRSQLASIPPIWPKLWRRLEEFLRSRTGLAGFLIFIRNTGERADDLTNFEQHSLDNFFRGKRQHRPDEHRSPESPRGLALRHAARDQILFRRASLSDPRLPSRLSRRSAARCAPGPCPRLPPRPTTARRG